MKRRLYLLTALAILLCYSGLIEPNWISEVTHDLTIDGLGLNEITIVHIGDIHIARFGRRESETIKRIEQIDPDYVLVTGDLFQPMTEVSAGVTFLSKLKARYGVYLVLGNADVPLLNAMRWKLVSRDTLKFRILMNESVDCGGFTLVGLDDPVSGRANTAEAFRGVPRTKPVFVMSHFHPDSLLWEIEREGAAMMFSGHTHGGQVGIAALVGLVPYARRSRYIAGLYTLDDFYLSVTKGIGTGIFPFRFLCRPEIAVFHLRRR